MRIAILAIPGVQMLDLAGPMDVFFEASRQLQDPTAYEVEVIALETGSVTALNGMRFFADAAIDAVGPGFDTVLVAGSPGIRSYEKDARIIDWVVDQAARARRLGSICTGAFVLAHAGLLDGKRATTHWNSVERLARTFPAIEVEPDRIFVKDGATYTSAGVTASMDLALAMVEEDHGRDLALRVAKELVLFLKRPGGQSQFSVQLASQVSEHRPIRDVHEFVLANLGADLSVDVLAGQMAMSVRNFSRLFKRETGATPGAYVEKARVEAARRTIEEADVPLKRVAAMYGFGDQSGLRRAFVRQIGVTPAEYRLRFRPESWGGSV